MRLVYALPLVMAGRMQDPTGLLQGMQLRLGVAALMLIKIAYLAKAQGGTDEAGDSWAPLSPKYIAYGRRHPGLAEKRAEAKSKGRPGRPLLSDTQDKRWRGLFAAKLHRTSRKQAAMGIGGNAEADAKANAAAYAWAVLKAEGGKTIFGEYSGAKVEILRDTGVGFNSLSPGVDGPSGHPNQVFRTLPNGVMVGTNRKAMAAHHRGSGKLPKRRLWPETNRWPSSWWMELLDAARDGAANILGRMLGS
jgi:hypothetical protein